MFGVIWENPNKIDILNLYVVPLNKEVTMQDDKTSSDFHREIQRANGYAEVAGIVLPGSDIPVRVAQTITSTVAFFKPNVKKHEKVINALQAILSVVGIVLQVAILFSGSNVLGLALKALDLIYQGTLLGVWGQSEVMRGESPPK